MRAFAQDQTHKNNSSDSPDSSRFSQLQAKHKRSNEAAQTTVPPIVNEVLRSSGQPLDSPTREFMESRFAHDFSHVRVHTDDKAANSAASVSALAYTAGRDVVFGTGQYQPKTNAGKSLLAHELTHVIQQQAGVHLKNGVGQAGDAYEAQADAVAETVASGKDAGALLERTPASATNSDQPVQMQKQEQKQGPQQPPPQQQPTGNITLELARKSFQEGLKKQKLNEEVNGEAAGALASAYLSTFSQATIIPTPYGLKDRDLRTKASYQEVRQAILSIMDIPKEQNAGVWKWTPAPKEKETRGTFDKEFTGWAGGEAVGYVKDEARDKLIEKAAVEIAATWEAAEGLEVVAQILVGGLGVVGWFTLAISVLELLVLLQKPVQKSPSRQDQILADVTAWLTFGEMMKQAAVDRAAKEKEAASHQNNSYQDNIKPINTRVYQLPRQ